jgi:SAM-dependent methyltransferase
MFVTETCPDCGSRRRFCWPARTASFIVDYVLSGETRDCNLCDCADCGLRYFDLRYTQQEMDRLYDDYRGERYVSVRTRHEPGYTNADATGDIEGRRNGVDRFLQRGLGERYSGDVLDFGGDDGALIPDFFTGRRLVFDVSNKPLVRGVERVKDLRSLRGDPPQFVLLCHVLEHLPDAASVLQHLSDLIPKGGKLYVEVPDERFRLKWLGPPRFYKGWFNELAQRHFIAPIVNLLVRWRQRGAMSWLLNRLPPIEDLVLHEHINFYTTSSLERLVIGFGFRATRVQRDSGVLRLLAERI